MAQVSSKEIPSCVGEALPYPIGVMFGSQSITEGPIAEMNDRLAQVGAVDPSDPSPTPSSGPNIMGQSRLRAVA